MNERIKPGVVDDTMATAGDAAARLAQSRLLLVFDALVREGSVSAVATMFGLQTSAVSRMLGELRALYDDPILVRTGRGMRPTPFADAMRLKLRAFATSADALLKPPGAAAARQDTPSQSDWNVASSMPPPPLSVARGRPLEGTPTPAFIAQRLADIGDNAEPQRRLAKYIACVAPGPGRSRTLTRAEAADALGIVLGGMADPLQIGGLLLVLYYRGVTSAELAGFIGAMRAQVAPLPVDAVRPDLDWPAYLSPRWRGAPWFIHAACLVARAGYRVLLHGHYGGGSEGGKIEAAAMAAGIPVCQTPAAIGKVLAERGIAYTSPGVFAPQVQALLALYPLFETRTPINSAVPLLNPYGAPTAVLGTSAGAHSDLYRDTALLAGLERAILIGSTRDFAQMMPDRVMPLVDIRGGEAQELVLPALAITRAKAPTAYSQREYWLAVWHGGARDDFAQTVIVYTAAAGLFALRRAASEPFAACLEQARTLWQTRHAAVSR